MTYNDIKINLYKFLDTMYLTKNYTEKEEYNINIILQQLFDNKLKKIYCLSELETNILRKYLKINNHKQENQDKISNYQIQNVLALARIKLNNAVNNGIEIKNQLERMTSFIPKEYENYYISDLNLDLSIEKTLFRNNIITLHDLLTLSKKDLLLIRPLGTKKIKSIESALKKLNLRFLDDLSISEKQEIIANSDDNIIFNSSLYWLNGLGNEKIDKVWSYLYFPKIKDAILYVKESKQKPIEMIEDAKLIGIDLINGKKIMIAKEDKLDEILNSRISLSNYLNCVFNYNNIYLIKELLMLDQENLKNILFNKNDLYIETLNYVHNMGLYFNFEINNLLNYSNIIETQLTKQKLSK